MRAMLLRGRLLQQPERGAVGPPKSVGKVIFNPFAHSLRAALDALATSDPSVTREAQRGCRHGVSGDRAVQRDHAALS